MKITKQQVGIALTTVFTIGISVLINWLPLNNITTLGVLHKFDFTFIPTDVTFYFWILVYVFLLVFAFGKKPIDKNEDLHIETLSSWYTLISIVNPLWLIAWHYQFFLTSTLLMTALFIALIAIYLITTGYELKSIKEKLVLQIPFQLYLGWIIFLVTLNISAVLHHLGWNNWGLTETVWTSILMLLVGTIGVFITIYLFDLILLIPLVWGTIGIIIKSYTQPEIIIVGIITLLFLTLIPLLKKFYKPKKKKAKKDKKKEEKVGD